MRNVSIVAGIALIALLPSTSAYAQAFNGPFVGVQAGWQKADVRNPETKLGPVLLDDDRQSLSGGLFAGYDRQVADRIVLGVEGGMDFGADDALQRGSGANRLTVDPKWSLDLTARAGYLVSPTTLAYVRGGYTNARLKTTAATAADDVSESEHRQGWLAGAGVERQIVRRISGRLEYRYSDLSEGTGAFDRHRILAGIAYRF